MILHLPKLVSLLSFFAVCSFYRFHFILCLTLFLTHSNLTLTFISPDWDPRQQGPAIWSPEVPLSRSLSPAPPIWPHTQHLLPSFLPFPPNPLSSGHTPNLSLKIYIQPFVKYHWNEICIKRENIIHKCIYLNKFVQEKNLLQLYKNQTVGNNRKQYLSALTLNIENNYYGIPTVF